VGIVMIKCPQTGSAISTGIKADRESFRCSAVFFARTFCSICRANHEWFAKEAWLQESSRSVNGLLAVGYSPDGVASPARLHATWPKADLERGGALARGECEISSLPAKRSDRFCGA